MTGKGGTVRKRCEGSYAKQPSNSCQTMTNYPTVEKREREAAHAGTGIVGSLRDTVQLAVLQLNACSVANLLSRHTSTQMWWGKICSSPIAAAAFV